jgi:hypothetical protein
MKYLIIVTIILQSFCSFGQVENRTRSKDINAHEKKVAISNGQKLKSSIVLFRIETKQKEIDYYRKYNNLKAAKALEEKTFKTNKIILDAVRASFNICPVYFFDGEYSRDILDGNLEKIVFLSDSLTKDSTIKIPLDKSFFIAEYAFTRGQYIQTYVEDYIAANEADSTINKDLYYENTTTKLNAFILMDHKFKPLTAPFPYYMKATFILKTSYVRSKIQKWNAKIENYLSTI